MSSLQFRVLFRHFLFRMPDPELLSAEGDMSTLFGQFAALLIFMGIGFSGSLMGLDTHLPKEAMLISAWGAEHSLISATMLVVGLFAV
ncbi:MAG: hypothetical protein H7039_21370, partial [Bryobacteraceae bacterium]|nr:hypothetical protein [Bryobacteraceae bacterium]